MAEEFVNANLILPGTYIRVRSEGLIGVAGISTGNIGVVGTAAQGAGVTHELSTAAEALAAFGASDAVTTRSLNLTRIVSELFRSGARTVYARGVATGAPSDDYATAFEEIVKESVQLLVAPDLSTANALTVLGSLLENGENNGQDMMAVVGADGSNAAAVAGQAITNDRIILCAPGYFVPNPADPDNDVALPGNFTAAPVAALISTLSPQSSPTNKVLPALSRLSQRFSYGERVDLVQHRIFVLEQRNGVRAVRGLTTDDGGFRQVTTRRKGAIDGFLTGMLVDEQLTDYNLEVTATRRDEIEGRAIVNALLQPTFSIDFVAVTLVLQ